MYLWHFGTILQHSVKQMLVVLVPIVSLIVTPTAAAGADQVPQNTSTRSSSLGRLKNGVEEGHAAERSPPRYAGQCDSKQSVKEQRYGDDRDFYCFIFDEY